MKFLRDAQNCMRAVNLVCVALLKTSVTQHTALGNGMSITTTPPPSDETLNVTVPYYNTLNAGLPPWSMCIRD